jgi:hypothetical protein
MTKLTIESVPVFVQTAIHTMALASNGKGQSPTEMALASQAIRSYISYTVGKMVRKRDYKTGIPFTKETALVSMNERIVRAFTEEETAITTDSYTRWNTREEVGDAELCVVTQFARNFLEENDSPYEEYQDTTGEDGAEFVNTIDWSERKFKEEELLDCMRSGKFSTEKLLTRAASLAKAEVISWKFFRVLRILAPKVNSAKHEFPGFEDFI